MKHEAFDHPKLDRAAADLGIPIAYFRGVMITLWHAAKIHFPAGDIGRESNRDIAWRAGYPGDGEEFVAVLLRHGLLDEMPAEQGRLYIHNWHLHCEDFVKQRLRARKMTFANGLPPYKKEEKTVKASQEQASEDEESHTQKTSERCSEARESEESVRKALARNAGNREPGISPQPPSGGECAPDPPPNGHLKPPDRPPDPFFESFEKTYLKRTVRSDEWITVREQLDAWADQGYPIKRRWFHDCCEDARAEVKDRTGKWPFTIKPLVDLMTERIGGMEASE